MRQDIKVLLGRIGEETFNYYDFESPSHEIDVWPIFEALLLDERVVGRIDAKTLVRVTSEAADEPRTLTQVPTQVPLSRPAAAPEPVRGAAGTGMFGNYGSSPPELRDESVRDVLARLASNAE